MIKATKPYFSNTTDDMLLAWSKTTPLYKMQWLEMMNRMRGLALPKKKRKFLRDLLHGM